MLDLLTEVTNNDLKYGFDQPLWELYVEDNWLYLKFSSKTFHTNDAEGNGRIYLKEIAEKLSMEISEVRDGDLYIICLKKIYKNIVI